MNNSSLTSDISLYNRIIASLPIILLFAFNVGSRQLFIVLDSVDVVIEGFFVLSVIYFLSFMVGRAEYRKLRVIVLVFYVYLIISSLFSTDTLYGLQKAFLGLIVPFLSFEIFIKKYRNELTVIDGLVILVVLLDIIAVVYKIRMGFFVRSVNFGVLGPITLGWLNGMAFLSLVLQKKKRFGSILLILIFFLVILWTGSKGPLIASLLITVFGFRRVFGAKLKTAVYVILGISIMSTFLMTYGQEIRSVRSITEFVSNPDEYSQGVGSGSIGTRQDYLNISKEMFFESPIFGVGFGGWNSSALAGHKYPHNVLFEILAELGIIGLILLIIFLINFRYFNTFGYIALFGFLSLMFSGDFSYLRYAIFPLLIAYYFYVKKEGKSIDT